MGGACLSEGGGGEACAGFLRGKTEGKSPPGRSWCRWEDIIKVDLQEVGCGGMDWIELAHDRHNWQVLVNWVMDLRVP
jgi:hypothetical protein